MFIPAYLKIGFFQYEVTIHYGECAYINMCRQNVFIPAYLEIGFFQYEVTINYGECAYMNICRQTYCGN